jgi:hypothetical protein
VSGPADETLALPELPEEPPAPVAAVAVPAAELRALIRDVYGPLTEVYEQLEQRLRERDGAVVGWATHLEALRALREERVAGDWEELARLLVAPASAARAQMYRSGDADAAILRQAVEAGGRVLVLAPTAAGVEQALAACPEVFAVRVDPVQAESTDDAAPEAAVSGALLRPVGDAWQQAWRAEAKLLQRDLLWLEQWPRDASALKVLHEAHERGEARTAAEINQLAAQLEQLREQIGAAEQAVEEAEEERKRLAEEEGPLAKAVTAPRAEADRLQKLAERAAAAAQEETRAADQAWALCTEIDEQASRAQAELSAALQREQALTEELVRAREELPRATEEAERLAAEAADAAADGHARYYRLVSAESALAAQRRKRTLSQRLHVSAAPPELEQLRAEVKARAREADEAAARARQAKEAAEQAEMHRAGLDGFVSGGGAQLTAARAAQEKLNADLTRLAAEREAATTEHQERARRAAEAVDLATQASTEARHAEQHARHAEERLAAARLAHQEAVNAAERARLESVAAIERVQSASAELERLRADAETQRAEREAEIEVATQTEARSRENIRQICGVDPTEAPPGLLASHQNRAMQQIELLTGYLETPDPLLPVPDLLAKAELICGTPVALAAAPLAGVDFETLVALDAGRLNDGDFLIGAVRARNWLLIGDPDHRPPVYADYGPAAERLADGPFGRAAAVLPDLTKG